jgi:MATE family multidrug resistance protein
MLFQSFKQFADGASHTTPGMAITIAGNVVNVLLNYALIWGIYFIEPMGLNGSAIATLIARWLMAAAGLFYFLRSRHYVRFRVYLRQLFRSAGVTIAGLREITVIGAPLAVQSVLEVAAFSLGAVMMGWVGATELAAHQTAINTASLTFMVMMGIAAATTIRVSVLYGAKNYAAMKRAANVSMSFAVVCMVFTACAYIFGRSIIPLAYVDDPAIVEVAARLFVMAGIFQIFDGVQVVALGALRGVADVRTPMLITVLAYLVLSLPVSYVAAFVFGLYEIGIWLGYVVGLFASSSLFVLRFRRFCREAELSSA